MFKNILIKPPDPEIVRRYVRWHRVKTGLEIHERRIKIKNGEIYWAYIGQNLGSEMYGKSEYFSRPVLIFKKLNADTFLGIPLTSQDKTGSWYIDFYHKGKKQNAVLAQIKVMSIKRLGDKMGEIDHDDYRKIWAGFAKLYLDLDL